MSTEKIKLIYQQNQTPKSDWITPVVFILLILSVFGYLYSNIQRKLMHMNWSEQKCNPRYLFFSGFLDPFNKNPWATTQDNFQRCVATNIYKDPSLSRVIQNNQYKIVKHKNEMKNNLVTSKQFVDTVHQGWEGNQEKSQEDLIDANTKSEAVFQTQEALYQQILLKTAQMFHTISSIVRYIQGILVFNLSNTKESLAIDVKHDYFMKEYEKIYNDNYAQAYAELSKRHPEQAINHARDAIENFNALNQELEKFMEDHYQDIQTITEGCYQLKYNMDDGQTCPLLFPNINQPFIDIYPKLKRSAQFMVKSDE